MVEQVLFGQRVHDRQQDGRKGTVANELGAYFADQCDQQEC